MKIAACQMPDIRESADEALSLIETYVQHAASQDVRLICFPECFLQGYLVEPQQARRHAISLDSPAFDRILKRLAHADPVIVFGMIEADGEALHNTAVVVHRGKLVGRYRKVNLLLGERASFSPGIGPEVFNAGGVRFGINICSDTQVPALSAAIASQGGKLVVCPSNNMMRRDNAERWKDEHHACRIRRASEAGVWLISSDVTGESGDRVGLGPTCVIDPQGRIVAQVPLMQVGMITAEIDTPACIV